jgi:5-methylcytosine-specific restriction endonuclease McrA
MTNARDLTAQLSRLLRREHDAMAEFIVALADFDRRRVWVELGYNGLFPFLRRERGLSKSAAFYRKTAAELVQRFPEVVEPLRHGKLCLSSVAELAKVLTPENRHEVLPRFFHASKQEAKEILAELAPDPAPARRDVVTALSLAAPAAAAVIEAAAAAAAAVPSADPPLSSGSPANLVRASSDGESRGLSPQRNEEPDRVEPLTAELRRIHVTVDREFLELLDATRDALSHSHPGATTSELLKVCMKRVLAEKAKQKGIVERPRKEPSACCSDDHIPAHVKRAVWKRDGGKCQWPLAGGGGICGSTTRLEFAHRVAKARGGKATAENIRLLCRVHNQYEARVQLGDEVMDRFSATRLRGGRSPRRGFGGASGEEEQAALALGP